MTWWLRLTRGMRRRLTRTPPTDPPPSSAVRRIRVEHDYGAFPVWSIDDGGEVDPSSLPVSSELVADLRSWSSLLDTRLNWDDPAATAEDLEVARRDLAVGRGLAVRLQAELGPGYAVWFGRDEPLTP